MVFFPEMSKTEFRDHTECVRIGSVPGWVRDPGSEMIKLENNIKYRFFSSYSKPALTALLMRVFFSAHLLLQARPIC